MLNRSLQLPAKTLRDPRLFDQTMSVLQSPIQSMTLNLASRHMAVVDEGKAA